MAESLTNTDNNSLTESLLSTTEKHNTEAQVISTSSSNTDHVPAVPPSSQQSDAEDPESRTTTSWDRGEKQPSQWRDLPFGLLFHSQCLAVTVLSVMYGIPAITNNIDTDATIDALGELQQPLTPLLIAIASATLFTIIVLATIVTQAKSFISCLLITSAIFYIMFGITALAIGSNVLVGIVPLVFGIIGICHFFAVRRRIPFAAANLQAGRMP